MDTDKKFWRLVFNFFSNSNIISIRITSNVRHPYRYIFNDEFIAQHGQPDVVITDPPRDGMNKDVVQQFLKISTAKRTII